MERGLSNFKLSWESVVPGVLFGFNSLPGFPDGKIMVEILTISKLIDIHETSRSWRLTKLAPRFTVQSHQRASL